MARSKVRTGGDFRAVSLFSNCGAGDIGYAEAGFHFEVMAELDSRRLEISLLNHPGAIGVPGDLRKTWPEVVRRYKENAGSVRPALLAACPPCQGLSSARSGRGLEDDPDAGSQDDRNLLVTVIDRVAAALRPSFIVVENVPPFLTRKVRHPTTRRSVSAAALLVEQLQPSYRVFPLLADLCEYGVPQTRKRTFLTFVRRDVDFLPALLELGLVPYPQPRWAREFGGAPIKLRDALQKFGFPSLNAGSPMLATCSLGDGFHSVPVWRDRRYAMVAAIPPNSGRSAWVNNVCESCGEVDVGMNAAECPICEGPLLRPVFLQRNGKYRLIRGFRSSTYSRMHPDKPAATITTASGHVGSNHTIHPYENRLLSPLECAYLQTFPQSFHWGRALQKWGPTNVRQMIGEAVPPLFTRQHGEILASLIRRRIARVLLSADDMRCRKACAKLALDTQ